MELSHAMGMENKTNLGTYLENSTAANAYE